MKLTRGDAQAALQREKLAGVTWTDLQVLDTQPFDAQTILVHVTYRESKVAAATTATLATASATTVAAATAAATPTVSLSEIKDALWPVRLENGAWRYNWNNLIDFRSLDAAPQSMNNITILPLQLLRYSDRLQVKLLVQNRTNQAVVFGQTNETLGAFYFGENQVVAEKTRWILNPLRSVPDATLEIKGLFNDLPERLTIRTWNNLNLAPWFDFQF